MALEGVQGMSDEMRAFVSAVRLYLRDFAELNRLVSGEESTNRMIAWAVLDAVSNFNLTPHMTTYSLTDLLQKNLHHLLLRMTTEALIESVGLLQTRNHINYSNGGINVGVNDKTPLLMNWLQYFKATTEQKLQRVKVAMNIEGAMDASGWGVHSELWAINGSYLAYS
jgi:hypothetical protein